MTKLPAKQHLQIADKTQPQVPLQLKVPNARTRAAMAEAEELTHAYRQRFRNADALFAEVNKNSKPRTCT